jgi:hypothetical protein
MSALIKCLFVSACSGSDIFYLLLDVVAPIILEIIIIGLLFDRIMDFRERKKWSLAKYILLSRLLRIQDELLLNLVPSEKRKASLTTINCGPIAVDMLFEWAEDHPNLMEVRQALDPYINMRLVFLSSKIVSKREQINEIIQAHSVHIEPELFGILLEMDSDLSQAETISSFSDTENSAVIIEAVYAIILSALKLQAWLIESKEIKFKMPLVAS